MSARMSSRTRRLTGRVVATASLTGLGMADMGHLMNGGGGYTVYIQLQRQGQFTPFGESTVYSRQKPP